MTKRRATTSTVTPVSTRISVQAARAAQAGSVFRLRGKGVPYIRGKGRGDEYVTIEVEIPKNLTSKQKSLLREFEADCEGKNYKKQRTFREKMKDLFKD